MVVGGGNRGERVESIAFLIVELHLRNPGEQLVNRGVKSGDDLRLAGWGGVGRVEHGKLLLFLLRVVLVNEYKPYAISCPVGVT
jgi:hypothetical protein